MEHFRKLEQKRQRLNYLIFFQSGHASSYLNRLPTALKKASLLPLRFHSNPSRHTHPRGDSRNRMSELFKRRRRAKAERETGAKATSRVWFIFICCILIIFDNFCYYVLCSYFLHLYYFVLLCYEWLNILVFKGLEMWNLDYDFLLKVFSFNDCVLIALCSIILSCMIHWWFTRVGPELWSDFRFDHLRLE
jgi:hypothetical protein